VLSPLIPYKRLGRACLTPCNKDPVIRFPI
jgi:hypothetical protein